MNLSRIKIILLGIPIFWSFVLCLPAWCNVVWTENGVGVCTNEYEPSDFALASDGSGGAIFVWDDDRSGNKDIYAQRIDVNGNEVWTTDGLAISSDPEDQFAPLVVNDGSTGAIIIWCDNISYTRNIHAQRLDANGNIQWTTDGVDISSAPFPLYDYACISDGSGGIIVCWWDYNYSNYKIHAQKLDSNGDKKWAINGVDVSTTSSYFSSIDIASDDSGGVFIAWRDNDDDIYSQWIDSAGNVNWDANGVTVCSASGKQKHSKIVSDGNSGAIIVWRDLNSNSGGIYGQKLDSNGNKCWALDGVLIYAGSADLHGQDINDICSDGSGGAMICFSGWVNDCRYDIFANRIDKDGNLPWSSEGKVISQNELGETWPVIISDGKDGGVIAWEVFSKEYESSPPDTDIYIQYINKDGGLNWSWATNGIALCTPLGMKRDVTMCRDNTDGIIIGWLDPRNNNFDIYAQRVETGVSLEMEEAMRIGNNVINPVQDGKSLIIYKVEKQQHVTITIYNLFGEKIKTLVNEIKDEGIYSIDWYGRNIDDKIVGSGIYFVLYKAGDNTATKRIMVVK